MQNEFPVSQKGQCNGTGIGKLNDMENLLDMHIVHLSAADRHVVKGMKKMYPTMINCHIFYSTVGFFLHLVCTGTPRLTFDCNILKLFTSQIIKGKFQR